MNVKNTTQLESLSIIDMIDTTEKNVGKILLAIANNPFSTSEVISEAAEVKVTTFYTVMVRLMKARELCYITKHKIGGKDEYKLAGMNMPLSEWQEMKNTQNAEKRKQAAKANESYRAKIKKARKMRFTPSGFPMADSGYGSGANGYGIGGISYAAS